MLKLLLSVELNRLPTFLQSRGDQEDRYYFQQKRRRREKDEADDKNLIDFSDEDFEKITNLGLEVVDCTQTTKPILKALYHEETHELKLVHNLDVWDDEMITLFDVFELKLLHPSYILFLRTIK